MSGAREFSPLKRIQIKGKNLAVVVSSAFSSSVEQFLTVEDAVCSMETICGLGALPPKDGKVDLNATIRLWNRWGVGRGGGGGVDRLYKQFVKGWT